MAIPDFSLLAQDFPGYRCLTPEGVKRSLGGEAGNGYITNTAAILLSHSMNFAGVSIPRFSQHHHLEGRARLVHSCAQ